MVRDAWSNLKMQFSNDEYEHQLVSYFDKNYIHGKIRMRYHSNSTPKRNEAIFPPEMEVSSTWSGFIKDINWNSKNFKLCRRIA